MYAASKDAELNFRGSPKGDFQGPRMFCAPEVVVCPLWLKWPARMVAAKPKAVFEKNFDKLSMIKKP